MKKKKSSSRTSTRQLRRLHLPILSVIAASTAIGAATVIARHTSAVESSPKRVETKYVTVKVAGRDIQVDPQTGQVKALTQDEAKQLAEGLKTMLNKSTDGLVQEQHPDGTVSMDLQGRFQNVAVAKINSDGSLSQSCVDNPEAAASFFDIDPQLLGVEQKAGSTTQPRRPVTVKAPGQ